MKPKPATGGQRASSVAVANAALVGWLALVVVNAVCAYRVPVELGPMHSLILRVYDAGQLLFLGAVSWVLVFGAWRLSPVRRVLLAVAVVGGTHYLLLATDLENFLRRHSDSGVPWHLLFTVATTLTLVGAFALGLFLSRSILRLVGVVAGLVLAAGNQFVLAHDYHGLHFIAAWIAASLIGTSTFDWVKRTRWPRRARIGLVTASVVALLSYVIIPGAVVRLALVRSPGAVAAPFVVRAWTILEEAPRPTVFPDSPWFQPRQDLPAIPAESLPGAPDEPIVILLTVDALRADVLEGQGAAQIAPHLLEMRDNSLSFSRAWAPAPYTMASLRTMFSGLYYLQQPTGAARTLRKHLGQQVEVERQPFLPALLESSGVTTVNLRTHDALARTRSICRGFGEELKLRNRASSEKVVAGVLERLDQGSRGALFLYSHMFDTHAPYTRGGTKGSQKDRYLAEVSIVDAAIGKLRRGLRKRRLHRRTYLFVTADHAEAFGEHGYNFHSTTVYEEMIRIPLLMEGPGIKPREVPGAISLIDIGPTILSLFGVSTPGHFMGASLVPFMRGEDPVLSRPLLVDGGRAQRAMLFEERWKVIVDQNRGTEELYDLQEDPGERINLAEQPGARARFETFHAFLAGLNPPRRAEKN